MDLKELIELLKDTTTKLEDFESSAENISGEKFAEKYIKENGLEYIADEIKKAFKMGFLYHYRQNKKGVFKD